jgi:hypothetical protein
MNLQYFFIGSYMQFCGYFVYTIGMSKSGRKVAFTLVPATSLAHMSVEELMIGCQLSGEA